MENIEIKNESQKREPRYKNEKCKVLAYDKKSKELDVLFKGYGVRLFDVEKPVQDFVMVKYTENIGSPNFKCKVANV